MDPIKTEQSSLHDQAMDAVLEASKAEETPKQSEEKVVPGEKPVEQKQELVAEPPKEEPKQEPTQLNKPSEIEIEGEKFSLEDIKRFREDSLNKKEWQSKLTQESQELSKVKETIEKIQEVFTQKEDKGEQLTPEEQKFRNEATSLFKDPYVAKIIDEQVENKLRIKEEELNRKKLVESITSEVKTLETELNGKDGRPIYVDKDVLEWQKKNNKMMLTPREAYEAKHHKELVEWEVQQRLKNIQGSPPKKTPSSPTTPAISDDKSTLPSNRFDRRIKMQELLSEINEAE